jgi:hypothetical protein
MYLLIYYHCIGSQPTEYVLRGKARVGIFFSAHVRLTEYVLSVIIFIYYDIIFYIEKNITIIHILYNDSGILHVEDLPIC